MKVFVASSNEAILDFFSLFFKEDELFSAKSGQECIKLVLKNIPDIIILDEKLPQRSSFQVAIKLKLRSVPVLYIYSETPNKDYDYNLKLPFTYPVFLYFLDKIRKEKSS